MKHCIQRSIVGISVPLYYGKKIEFYAKCNGESETRSFASSIRWEIFKVVMHTQKSLYISKLVDLYISNCKISDETLYQIRERCPNLQYLIIARCYGFSTETIGKIVHPNLE